jgi:hypothetical protein
MRPLSATADPTAIPANSPHCHSFPHVKVFKLKTVFNSPEIIIILSAAFILPTFLDAYKIIANNNWVDEFMLQIFLS